MKLAQDGVSKLILKSPPDKEHGCYCLYAGDESWFINIESPTQARDFLKQVKKLVKKVEKLSDKQCKARRKRREW